MELYPLSGTTDASSKLEECTSSKEREHRSVALEKTYVHDVYQQIACHFSDTRYRAWPRVRQFLVDLEPGSIVCDVGCGNGKHLDINPHLYKIGIDRCSNLTAVTREKGHEVLVSDNLALPFRDDCMDAVLSVAVVHHFASRERRVESLRELARVLRIGGKILVSVWAMEQRHRKFESQDVLVPWNQPMMSSSDDKTSSIERDLNSTTTTSDDEATHYHAYTQTSDSDSFPSLSQDFRKRIRLRHRGKSIDPACSSQSSSDLSSPNESCYTFVRRAIQKLAGNKRNRMGRRPWFLQGLSISDQDDIIEPLASMDEDAGEEIRNAEEKFGPIVSSNFSEFLRLGETNPIAQRSLIFSNLLGARRRRTLETTRELQHPSSGQISAQPKSKSLSDLLGLIPIGFFRNRSPDRPELRKQVSITNKGPAEDAASSELLKLEIHEVEFPEYISHKAVQTDSLESMGLSFNESFESRGSSFTGHSKATASVSPESSHGVPASTSTIRPVLVKQKHSVASPLESPSDSKGERSPEDFQSKLANPDSSWVDIKSSVKKLPEFKSTFHPVAQPSNPTSTVRVTLTGSSIWKQTSLNEELIFSERIREKENLKQHIQKQCSLNEEFINKERENTSRWDQMKGAFLNPSSNPSIKCIQFLKNGISSRFRGYETPFGSSSVAPPTQPMSQANSIKNGFVRMLQNWKQGDATVSGGDAGISSQSFVSGTGLTSPGARHLPKEGARRGLFPPFFLRRSSAGCLNVAKKDVNETSSLKLLSPPPYLTRRPSENELVGSGNKLVPGVRHVRKLSREDGSDSSKDSSFQSDTSVDSEDSFASVIFIPRGNDGGGGNESCFFGSETRASSLESDRSPKSPARLSPPNHSTTPKSPSPLASEIGRRRSPATEKVRKFVFDDYATQDLTNVSAPTIETLVNPSNIIGDISSPLAEITSETILTRPPILVSEVASFQEEPEFNPAPVDERQQQTPRKKKVEKIDVLRKPVNLPTNKAEITRKLVRRSLPKALAVELYNPEKDDADTSDTSSSSSPNSVSSCHSVVSVVNEESAVAQRERKIDFKTEELNSGEDMPKSSICPAETENKESSWTWTERGTGPMGSSSQSLKSYSSPTSSRKLAMGRIGNTTEWLCSIPSDTAGSQGYSKRNFGERRQPGEKILLGEVKKLQQKGSDTKWPASIIDESPPEAAKGNKDEEDRSLSQEPLSFSASADIAEKLLEEMEEKDSLFDSIENLTSRQQPSRNPSLDSSVRLSSNCSCSIRGGDSFDSAKSSFTNSSSNQHKPSLTSSSFPQGSKFGNYSSRRGRPESSKSSSAAGEEECSAVQMRYFHVFKEGELDNLIEKYIQNLHIIKTYYDHAHWCIIAEKVQVWTI